MTIPQDGKASADRRRALWIVLPLNATIAAGFLFPGLIGDSSAAIAVKGRIEILRDAWAD